MNPTNSNTSNATRVGGAGGTGAGGRAVTSEIEETTVGAGRRTGRSSGSEEADGRRGVGPRTGRTGGSEDTDGRGGVGRRRLAVVGVTVAAAIAWWVVLSQLAGIELQAKQGGTLQIGVGSVFFASAAMAFAGWGLLALLERRTVNARKVWIVVAIIACINSLGSPLFNGIGLGAKLGLASLHLVVGAAVILGLSRTALTATERCAEGERSR